MRRLAAPSGLAPTEGHRLDDFDRQLPLQRMVVVLGVRHGRRIGRSFARQHRLYPLHPPLFLQALVVESLVARTQTPVRLLQKILGHLLKVVHPKHGPVYVDLD